MITGQYDEQLSEPQPAQVESETGARSRLRSTIAMVFCCGALWWTMHTVLMDNHAAKEAIRAMGSTNASERVGAIQELEIAGLGNGPIAIPPLIVALGDENARVRTAAAAALGPIGNDTSSSGSDREAVRAAIMALLGSLKDPEPSVRAAAANALMALPVGGKPAFVETQAVLVILVDRLGDGDTPTRVAVLQIMAALEPGSEVEPPKEVIAALRDESASIRAMAAVTLASFARNLDRLIPSLFRMIENDEPKVSAACVAVLERMKPATHFTPAVVPGLIAALGRPGRHVRALACLMLEKLGPEARAAIPALIATAHDTQGNSATSNLSRWDPVRLAIAALGRIAPRTESAAQVVAVLTDLIRDEAPDVWRAAVNSLDEFGPDAESAVPELIRALPKSIVIDAKFPSPTSVTWALSRIAPGTPSAGESMVALVGLLRPGVPEVRKAASDALAAFGPAGVPAIPDLIRTLNESTDPGPSGVANSAAMALSRIATGTSSRAEAVAALTSALKSGSRSTRFAAARALQSFGDGAVGAIPHLRPLLNDPDSWVRSAAQTTLDTLLEAGGATSDPRRSEDPAR